jgi:hypothetical protein
MLGCRLVWGTDIFLLKNSSSSRRRACLSVGRLASPHTRDILRSEVKGAPAAHKMIFYKRLIGAEVKL